TTFFIYGDRAPVEIEMENTRKAENFRRQFVHRMDVKMQTLRLMFEPVTYRTLAPYMEGPAYELYEWSTLPPPGVASRQILEIWMNSHFCADSLNPAGMGCMGLKEATLNKEMV